MPRSKRPRVSKVIIMPTLKQVKVELKERTNHKGTFLMKAGTYIKSVFGQISKLRPRIPASNDSDFDRGVKATYIGRQKDLGDGEHYRVENMRITPNKVRTKDKNPTKVHPKFTIT